MQRAQVLNTSRVRGRVGAVQADMDGTSDVSQASQSSATMGKGLEGELILSQILHRTAAWNIGIRLHQVRSCRQRLCQ